MGKVSVFALFSIWFLFNRFLFDKDSMFQFGCMNLLRCHTNTYSVCTLYAEALVLASNFSTLLLLQSFLMLSSLASLRLLPCPVAPSSFPSSRSLSSFSYRHWVWKINRPIWLFEKAQQQKPGVCRDLSWWLLWGTRDLPKEPVYWPRNNFTLLFSTILSLHVNSLDFITETVDFKSR